MKNLTIFDKSDSVSEYSEMVDRLIEILSDFGLTENEAKIFIFLGKIPLSFKKMAEDKKIKISTSKVDSQLTGFADTDRLSEVFTNLIQNSVDFVEPVNGKIEINAKDKGDNIQFSVKDNGLGIPLDKQEQIFKTKFYQVDTSMERKHGGSGLGLVIVKGIVEQGGGKIWFNSKQNEGTEMIFTIPKTWN